MVQIRYLIKKNEALTSPKPEAVSASNVYENIVPVLSGHIPKEVDVPEMTTQTKPLMEPNELSTKNRPYFDFFSWQSFIALNWPASLSDRGVPIDPDNPASFAAVNKSGEETSLVVWNTYREGFELMPPDGSEPPAWNGDDPSYSPHGLKKDGRLVFGMTTKGGLMDEINEAFGGPLVDQKRNYVRYDVRINEIEYKQIRGSKWYDKEKLLADIKAAVDLHKTDGNTPAEGVQFNDNSIELKGSWRILTDQDDISRYYTVEGWVQNDDKVYEVKPMGLVGLHVMQKTKNFPQWIWSTFEHVDNLSGDNPSFHNGTDSPSTGDRGYNCEPTVLDEDASSFPSQSDWRRNPVQVARIDPIPTTPNVPEGYSTSELNKKYQELLAGTVFANYELVGTQWPTNPSLNSPYDVDFDPADYEGSLAGDPFPGRLANVTMETYFQTNSCMKCHYHAAAYGVDYSWIVANRVLGVYANTPKTQTKKFRCQNPN